MFDISFHDQPVDDKVQSKSPQPTNRFAPSPLGLESSSPRTLLLDLGTQTGWARWQDQTPLRSGTLCLATDEELDCQRRLGKDRLLDVRFVRMHTFLTAEVHDGVKRVVFEDVLFASSSSQTQLWSSLRCAIWAVALHYPELSIFAVPTATMKKFATGNGHADKPQMAQALVVREPARYLSVQGGHVHKIDGTLADDNEVDALWLGYFTAAVDRGEQQFLGVHQRHQLAKAEQKKKKAEARKLAKAKRLAASAEAKAKKAALRTAIRSLGRCCGIWRLADKRRAICRKCGSTVGLPKLQVLMPQHSDVVA